MVADIAPFKFTSQTAAEAGRRSGESRREARLGRTLPPLPRNRPDKVERSLNAQARLVEQQIRRTAEVLNDDSLTAGNRAQLLKALDSLLDRQRILLNVPGPGTLKPTRNKPTRDQSLAVPRPVLAASKPAQVSHQPEPPKPAEAPPTPQPVDNCGGEFA